MPDDTKVIEDISNDNEKITSPKTMTLKKPIEFEGKTVTKIDLSGLDNLNGKDVKELDRLFRNLGGARGGVKEFDSTYLQLVASRATGYPLEFFETLSIKDVTLLEVLIRNFLLL